MTSKVIRSDMKKLWHNISYQIYFGSPQEVIRMIDDLVNMQNQYDDLNKKSVLEFITNFSKKCYGVNMNDKQTLLFSAVTKNLTSVVDRLLEVGASPNIKNEDQVVAIKQAVRNNNEQMAIKLFNAGLHFKGSLQNSDQSVYEEAINNNMTNLVKLINLKIE